MSIFESFFIQFNGKILHKKIYACKLFFYGIFLLCIYTKVLDPLKRFFLKSTHTRVLFSVFLRRKEDRKIPENWEKTPLYERKERGQIRMLKRLFLRMILMAACFAPVVAFAEDVQPSPESREEQPALINEGALCNYNTLGAYGDGDDVVLYAIWTPKVYNCGAGYYLKRDGDSINCATCPKDSYCKGFTNYEYKETESDHGKENCPAGYRIDSEGSARKQDCYKTETVLCKDKNPYSTEHASQVLYDAESSTCTQHVDGDSVCSASCEVTGLVCDSDNYEPQKVDGMWRCVEVKKECPAGQYLPKESRECAVCPEDHYCPGGSYRPMSNDVQGVEPCKDDLRSPKGTSSVKDCGKILRIGGDALYLHSDKRSSPSLVIKDSNGKIWYANATPVSTDGAKAISEDSTKQLHIKMGDVEYTIHTSIIK